MRAGRDKAGMGTRLPPARQSLAWGPPAIRHFRGLNYTSVAPAFQPAGDHPMAFPRRFAVFLLIMVALVATAGCGAGNLGDGGNQAQPPAAAEAPREPDQIALPEDGGKWPWPIVAAEPAAPEQAFDLTEHIPPKRRFWSAAVNPRAGRAAVMITDEQASATPH